MKSLVWNLVMIALRLESWASSNSADTALMLTYLLFLERSCLERLFSLHKLVKICIPPPQMLFPSKGRIGWLHFFSLFFFFSVKWTHKFVMGPIQEIWTMGLQFCKITDHYDLPRKFLFFTTCCFLHLGNTIGIYTIWKKYSCIFWWNNLIIYCALHLIL